MSAVSVLSWAVLCGNSADLIGIIGGADNIDCVDAVTGAESFGGAESVVVVAPGLDLWW